MKNKPKNFRNIAIIIFIFVFATLAIMVNNFSNQTSGNFIEAPVNSSYNLGFVVISVIIFMGLSFFYLEKISKKLKK
ncbi:MAG: hypothetical protein HY831_02750 [Candidatus Aenigmarchaeota archaeon]|nr:hypothetical protein [Candidatus Aenigmarchaeota archaeon]